MKGNYLSNVDKLIISLISSEFDSEEIKDIDWNLIFRTARTNRLDGIVYDSLDRAGLFEILPEKIREKFEESYRRTVINTRIYLETAGNIYRSFSESGIDLIVLRGPAIGLTLYARPYLRPFADLDLLVKKEDIPRAGVILGKLDFVPLPGTLPPRYFQKHHLHLSFKNFQRNTTVELHWALDHPYTLYTVDYPSLFAEKEEVPFEESAIPVLSPEDRFITLCLHLVKHCPFLPLLIEEDDFPNLLLKGRWMLWLLDIHLLLSDREDSLDWGDVSQKAEKWGLDKEIAVCVAACGRIFQSLIPAKYRAVGFRNKANSLERLAYKARLALLRGEKRDKAAGRFFFSLRSETIFRPIRVLDLVGYLFPPPEYIRRKYRSGGTLLLLAYLRHIISGIFRLTRNLMDLIYYRFK